MRADKLTELIVKIIHSITGSAKKKIKAVKLQCEVKVLLYAGIFQLTKSLQKQDSCVVTQKCHIKHSALKCAV